MAPGGRVASVSPCIGTICDSGGDECLRGGQIVELVVDPWPNPACEQRCSTRGSEAPGWRVAPRENQRLASRSARLTASRREPVALGQHEVEVVDEQAAALQARGLGDRHPGYMMHDRQLGVAAAEALDRLVRLELEHLDGELRVCAAQVSHCRLRRRFESPDEGAVSSPRSSSVAVSRSRTRTPTGCIPES